MLRSKRTHAAPPDAARLDSEKIAESLEQVGHLSAGERAKQCSVPREGGWRPGARWARQGRGQTVFKPSAPADPPTDTPTDTTTGKRPALPSQRERRDVEAAIAALPAHRQPPVRELGRSSEAAPNPFAGAGREMAKRCEPASHPFVAPREGRPSARDGHNGEAGFIDPPNLARLADMPAVRHHGEGPRPSSRGGNIDNTGLEKGRFFQTGRNLGSLVSRVCRNPDTESDAADIAIPAVPLPERPLATIETSGARVELVALCPLARARGLKPSMALTTARAQVPDLDTHETDRDGDAHDLAQLADILARRWSPSVEISDTDGLLIDLTGVAHLRGGEEAWCRRLVRMLARRGFTARMAVADTPGAAWGLARYGMGDAVAIVQAGQQAEALGPLPPAALRLGGSALDLLHRLGVEQIGQLIAMPRAPLARRFTRTIVDRLDQALGRAPQALDPVAVHDAIAVARRFLEPIATPEAIEQVLRDLVPDLVTALAEAGQGVRSLELVADRVDGIPQRLRTGFAQPTRDGAHIARMIVRRIEEIEPGYGIDAMTLHVRRADALQAQDLGPRLVEKTRPDLASLVDAIVNRIGERRLWRIRPVESEVPERALVRTEPLGMVRDAGMRLGRDDVRRLDTTRPNHPWHPRWRRPARLLARPERVHNVMSELPDLPPRRFSWRGQDYKVMAAEGPERITGEWWRRAGERWSVRDYFLVETEGGEWFWLFRRGDGVHTRTGDLSWYLHGR